MAEAGTGVADAPRNPGVADDDTRPRRKRKCGTRFGGDGSRGGGSRIGGDGGMHGGIGCSGDGGVGGTGVADAARDRRRGLRKTARTSCGIIFLYKERNS